MHVRAAYLLASISAICASTTIASADDLPRSGDYKVIYTGVNIAPVKPIPIGENQFVVMNSLAMTAVNAEGAGFLHNLAGRCVGMATLDNDAKTVESHGRCVYADANGDQIFEKYDYPMQTQGAGLQGTAEWSGGTGKFAGISGAVTLSTTRLSSITDGIVQVSGLKTGQYSFKNTTSSLK